MLKIIFHLNSLGQGGLERVVSNLSNKFAADGHQVLVATEWYEEMEFALDERIRRIHVGLTQADEKRGRIVKMHLRNKYFWQIVKEEKPDIVLAFGHKAIYRALVSTFVTDVPTVGAVRTDPVGHYDRPSDKLLIPLLYRRAAGFVFQTQGQRDFFPEYVRNKARIILNPLHDKYLSVPKPRMRKKEVVQSGRIVDFKNQAMLLKAFIRVHEKHPEYCLKLYGGDSHDGTWAELEEIIDKNKAEHYIHLMGASDNLENELADAGVFAFSSDWEGLPNALMEAMALGLPIVATDCPCGGPATLITHKKDGLLIPIKDEDALVDGILTLIENPDLAKWLGENARGITDKANSKVIFAKWMDYISFLAGK